MPQIKHSEIVSKIEELEKINEQEKIDFKAFHKCLNFLLEHNFYLTSSECEKINAIRKEIDAKSSSEGVFRIIYQDLKPNPEMNASFYQKEEN
jgi:hypothetical protein